MDLEENVSTRKEKQRKRRRELQNEHKKFASKKTIHKTRIQFLDSVQDISNNVGSSSTLHVDEIDDEEFVDKDRMWALLTMTTSQTLIEIWRYASRTGWRFEGWSRSTSCSNWPPVRIVLSFYKAINNLKANAAALNRANNSKPVPPKELPKPDSEHYQELHKKSEPSTALPEHRSSSSLPPDSEKTK
ncbi:Coiled-coil domain-containing protein 16 [Abeliophyllum distichum]|uniref:Coiled-coil domain-containing protein 16 n=1 Tax=Abeliophyllum distichum TaxID=126358 RepID=A0ABD1SG91_9LAMI